MPKIISLSGGEDEIIGYLLKGFHNLQGNHDFWEDFKIPNPNPTAGNICNIQVLKLKLFGPLPFR